MRKIITSGFIKLIQSALVVQQIKYQRTCQYVRNDYSRWTKKTYILGLFLCTWPPKKPHTFLNKCSCYISGLGSSDQSKGNCINGRSIKDCWFSFSKVIPGISSPNLTATYIDDVVNNSLHHLQVNI